MNAAAIARALPGSLRNGAAWLIRCPLPDHGRGKGDLHPSLSVCDGEQGRLLVRCFAGCRSIDVLAALRDRGLLEDQEQVGRGGLHPHLRRHTGAGTCRSSTPPRDDANRGRAREIWAKAVPIAGTPGEVYLRSRGLDPAQLNSDPPAWPETLRYSTDAGREPGRRCQALVIAVNDAQSGIVVALHRVFLREDGAPVVNDRGKKVKLSLGPIAGNAARLSCWPDPAGCWALAEGVETALAARQLTGIPTWAAISASNVGNVTPPSWARHAIVFADHDAAGERAAAAAADAFQRRPGIETVRIIRAAEAGRDAADLLEERSYG